METGTTESKINLNKIQEVFIEKKRKNETKEKIFSNLKDLSDLYNIQGKELVKIKKKLRDVEGDIVIKDVVIKEKITTIKIAHKEIERLKDTINHAVTMEHKLDEIIEKLIVNR